MTDLGTVSQLWVFPVKSMSGAPVDRVEVTGTGLVGDRSWAVVDADGSPVTARQEPRLREAVARLVDGTLVVDVPGAPDRHGEDAAAEALSAWLGRRVTLAHRAGGFVDVAPVHLVSTRSVADAAHAEECEACDVAAPRANLVLELLAGAASEREWVGREVRAGESALSVVRLPAHCLGAYAEVRRPGWLTVGDTVREG